MRGISKTGGAGKMKDRDECLYYLVREMNGGLWANPVFFEDMLKHIETGNIEGISYLEVMAVVQAAHRRDRGAAIEGAVMALLGGGNRAWN